MNDGDKGEEVVAAKAHRAGFSNGFWFVLAGIGLLVFAGLFFFASSTGSRGPATFEFRTATRADSLLTALRTYKVTFGNYPTGDGPAIFRALLGDNPQRERFLDWSAPPDALTGELPDLWGTPYRIYFSGDDILVRSAGPNRQFDDSSSAGYDDLIYGTHRR